MKTILYIAQTIDGFIANDDGSLDWLTPFEESGEDYGYTAFLQRIDAVVMGAKTYHQVLGFDLGWPYQAMQSFVLTNQDIKPAYPDIELHSGNVEKLVDHIRKNAKKDLWLVGGADIIRQFQEANLIDEYILFTMPVLIGTGIPLFSNTTNMLNQSLQCTYSKQYDSGVIQTNYVKQNRDEDKNQS